MGHFMKQRTSDVTYQQYLQAVGDLKAQGVAASVRAVQKVIGGSNSTILEYQRKMQADAAIASTVDDDISDAFRQSILAEFGRVVQSTRERLEALLAQERQQLKEAKELLKKLENRNGQLEEPRQEENKQNADKILSLEKQL